MGMKPRRRRRSAGQWGAGDPATWRPLTHPDGRPQTAPLGEPGSRHKSEHALVFGEHPHGRQDSDIYALDGEEPVAFSGHRVAVKLEIEEFNYYKSSGLTGTEIRGACRLLVRFNGHLVYGEEFRRADQAAIWWAANAHRLFEHPVNLFWPKSLWEFPDLVGRKILYKGVPALVKRYIPDQGAAIIDYDGVDEHGGFPPIDPEIEGHEPRQSAKVDILQEDIGWFRR